MRKVFKNKKPIIFIVLLIISFGAIISSVYFYTSYVRSVRSAQDNDRNLRTDISHLREDYLKIKNEDQFARNDKLQKEITDIEKTYAKSILTYEELLKLREVTNKTEKQDDLYTQVLELLSKRNYASAQAMLTTLDKEIDVKRKEVASSFSIPQNVPQKNEAPGSGYARQSVQTENGSYLVDVVAADLNSTRVIVDTASDGDCKDNCPVMALGDFVSRSGAFAGVNGPYFCPASYPSCAGKTNSFDTLIMNKNKVYFNSENNVYSTVPVLVFFGNSGRLMGRSSDWGRDTGVDSVIAGQPMLVQNGEVTFGGDEEVKRAGKGSRSFVGYTGNTAYIGVVHNANVAEVARVLKAMGVHNAINLDSGGTTALWSGRYVVGPGRNSPFGILFVRK